MVLSDCRFGLHHKDVFCVLLTHQLRIRSPFGKWSERLLQKWNYKFINRFNECWVPDFENKPGLAGELSHPEHLPAVPVKYIGGLSRFDACVRDTQTMQYDLLIVLSGPEPQRSIFENILLNEVKFYKGRAALVRGLPGAQENISCSNVEIFNHLPAKELCALMISSPLIISRSGYTTVMDLIRLGKKSVLVPTPGQTEQEYLGRSLMQQQLCVCVEQHQFSLEKALELAAGFEYADVSGFDMELYKSIIKAERGSLGSVRIY
ncbi:MAG: glycosyltransferase [Chitinophagaceae bacterium]